MKINKYHFMLSVILIFSITSCVNIGAGSNNISEMLSIESSNSEISYAETSVESNKISQQEQPILDAFSIHVLELGNKYNGDSIYIKANDIDILIDAGSRNDSSDDIIKYVDAYCDDGLLEYVIVTHAHQDHIAGFVGKSNGIDYEGNKTDYNGIFYYYNIGTIIDFSLTNSTTGIYSDYLKARDYAIKKGAKHYTASQCVNERDGAQKKYQITDSISMSILNTKFYENKASNENDYSVCALFTYEYDGNVKNYLFTGDLEEAGEKSLIELNDLPEVELFKGGHHGSKTSSGAQLLSIIKPKNVVVSCVAGSNEYTNNYLNTFPTQEFIDRVGIYTDNVYVTSYYDYSSKTQKSLNGNIVFITFENETSFNFSNDANKLKNTAWFNSLVYVDGETISDKKVEGGKEVPWRTWSGI